jgi:hypothetical protein
MTVSVPDINQWPTVLSCEGKLDNDSYIVLRNKIELMKGV